MDEPNKITVLVAAGLYPPDIGGPATYARMIEEELPKTGFTVKVIPYGEVRHLPIGIRHISYMWHLWRAARGCQLIYALDPVSVGLPAFVVSYFRYKPLVVRLGGDYAWEQGRQRFGMIASLDEYTINRKLAPWQVKVLAWIQDVVVRNARRVIVPGQSLKKIVETWTGVQEARVSVIHSALHPLSVTGTREELRKQLAFDGPVIVSAGRLVPWKGMSGLLDALVRIREHHQNVTLVIAGDGPERALLEKKIQLLELSEHVRLAGSLTKEALGATLRAADVFVLNTGYEGLSHQLLEVMDLGVPIVTTDINGNAELIDNGVHGLLVPYNNTEALAEAVTKMLDSQELRERCTQNARLRLNEFSQTAVVKKLAEVLHEVV